MIVRRSRSPLQCTLQLIVVAPAAGLFLVSLFLSLLPGMPQLCVACGCGCGGGLVPQRRGLRRS